MIKSSFISEYYRLSRNILYSIIFIFPIYIIKISPFEKNSGFNMDKTPVVIGYRHTGIITKDINKSLNFYQNILLYMIQVFNYIIKD